MNIPMVSAFPNRFALPLAATLTCALFLTGCLTPADKETDAVGGQAPAAISEAEGFAILESMGYSKDKIEASGTSFIVEGDMAFSYEALAGFKGSPLAKTAQRASVAIPNPKPNLLKIAIHSSMTDWAKYVHQAVNHWNGPNTRLHLEIVPITSAPNITIYSDASTDCPAEFRNLNSGIHGIAYVGINGFPGSAICMNKDSEMLGNPLVRVGLITHELGHTLGFFHTDSQDGSQVPNTPATDNPSIMQASVNVYWTNSLSYNDIRALETLYNSDKPLGGTDLDGDRKDDIVYWRPSNGMWSYLKSSTNFASSASSTFGQRGDIPLADTDLDGDGLDDRVVWRTTTFRAMLSSNGMLKEYSLGTAGDVPIGNHDMDGDGKDDLVVWRWSDAMFYVLTSRSNFATKVSYPWGDFGDIPLGGIDADRDGKDDFVYWRATTRVYWVRYSASNFTTSAPFSGGQPGDIPVGGTDLDRDGKDDLVTWRPGDGNFTALTSGSDYRSTLIYQWGGRGDVPLIGTDVDQDGRRDIGIWRPSIGTYYFRLSGTGFATSRSFVWGQ